MAENSKIEWRNIPGYEGRYQVSPCGKVRRIAHAIHRRDGVKQTYSPLILSLSGKPYKFVRLHGFGGGCTKWYVHRLVMLAFVGLCPDGQEVNHKDGNKLNNHLDNLEYVTRSENNTHAGDLTGCRRGSQQWRSKLTEGDVRRIKRALRAGAKQKDLAARYGVTHSNISAIKRGYSWAHLEVDHG